MVVSCKDQIPTALLIHSHHGEGHGLAEILDEREENSKSFVAVRSTFCDKGGMFFMCTKMHHNQHPVPVASLMSSSQSSLLHKEPRVILSGKSVQYAYPRIGNNIFLVYGVLKLYSFVLWLSKGHGYAVSSLMDMTYWSSE
ncbi:hypothetical protein Tco_0701950 [Tanacetum coccineum]|uniref:Uncharacterized protein n=1 Tax=Tanacetum coccineum TaxID=301880 RepID=A0ABQ4XUM6_9ASTR